MVTSQSVLSLSLGFHIAFIPSRLRPPVFRLGYVVSIEWVADYAKKIGLVKPPYQRRRNSDSEDVSSTEIDSDSNAPVDKAPETREKRWISRCSVKVNFEDVNNHFNAKSETVSLNISREFYILSYLYYKLCSYSFLYTYGTI